VPSAHLSSPLSAIPIQALEIEVRFDQRQRVVSTTTNDIIVWQ
jgi:hypothetical protein